MFPKVYPYTMYIYRKSTYLIFVECTFMTDGLDGIELKSVDDNFIR